MSLPDPEMILHGYAIFLRAGAFLFLLPLVGKPVPVMVRVAASLYLAFLMLPLVEPAPALLLPGDFLDLALMSMRELLIGALMGFGVQLLFHTVHFAGQLMSMEIGLMQSNLFNPMTGQQDTVISTAFTMLVIVLIFMLDIHHSLILAFKRSLEIMPGGSALGSAMVVNRLIADAGKVFIIGVQMSAPLIAINYIVTLSFAVLGRAIPNMNVMMVSFGVRIGMGLIVLILVLVVVVQILIGMIYDSPERMLQLLPFP
jgi:flagellar biosynthetic protein FliR